MVDALDAPQRWPCRLLVLLFLDAVLMWWGLGRLSLGQGMFSYGDLPAFYFYGLPPVQWVAGVAVYRLAAFGAALALGPSLGQNLTYIAGLCASSVGIWLYGEQLASHKLLTVPVAFTLGTVVNPLLTLNLLNGAFEWVLWPLCVCIALAFLWRSENSDHRLLDLFMAGLFVALSGLQAGSLAEFPYAAITMAAWVVVPFLGLSLYRRAGLGLRAVATGLASFLLGAIPSLAIIGPGLLSYSTFLGSASQQASARAYATGNAAFTYSPYSLASSLFNQPFRVASNGWFSVLVIPWLVILLVVIVATIAVALTRRGDRRVQWSVVSLAVYFSLVLFLAGVQSGLLLWVFSKEPLFDFVDSPLSPLYAQLVALVAPAILSAGELLTLMTKLPFRLDIARLRSRRTAGASESASQAVWVVRVRRRRLSREAATLSTLLVMGLAAVATVAAFSPSLESQLAGSYYTYDGEFAPPWLAEVHNWWEEIRASPHGLSFVLPNNYSTYSKVEGYMPLSELWYIPFLGNIVNTSDNTSRFDETLTFLTSGDVSSFAYVAGLSGVQYILILNLSQTVSVVPSYLASPGSTINESVLMRELSNTSSLRVVSSDSRMTVFEDLDYEPEVSSPHPVIAEVPSASGNVSSSQDLLTAPSIGSPADFNQWLRYPSTSVADEANGTVGMYVNGSAQVPYSLFMGSVNISEATSAVSNVTVGNVSVPGSLYTVSYSLTASITLTPGVKLYLIMFWYNVTAPSSLYTEFQATTVYTDTAPSKVLTVNISVPNATRSGRLVIDAQPLTSTSDGWAYVSSVAFLRTTAPSNLSRSPGTGQGILDVLASAGLVPAGADLLAFPLSYAGALDRLETVGISQATTIDENLSPNLSILASQLGLLGGFGQASLGALVFLPEGPVTIRVSAGSSCWMEENFSAGQTSVVPLALACAPGAQLLNLSMQGRLVLLSFVGLAPPATPLSVGEKVTLLLPLGALIVSETASGTVLTRASGGVVPRTVQAVSTAFEYLPITWLIGGSVLLAYFRFRQRKEPRQPRDLDVASPNNPAVVCSDSRQAKTTPPIADPAIRIES